MTIIGHSYSLVKSSTKCAPALCRHRFFTVNPLRLNNNALLGEKMTLLRYVMITINLTNEKLPEVSNPARPIIKTSSRPYGNHTLTCSI